MDYRGASNAKVPKMDETAKALELIFNEMSCFGDQVDGSDMMKTLVDSLTDMRLVLLNVGFRVQA